MRPVQSGGVAQTSPPLVRPAVSRAVRWIAPIAVGLIGAWLSMAAFGAEDTSMGPFRVRLDAGFGRSVTDLAIPPFGRLTADTHAAPVRVTATLEDVQVPELSSAIAVDGTDGVAADVERDAVRRIGPFALRLFAVATAGALVAALCVFRTAWRSVVASVLSAVVLVGGSELTAWSTYRTEAFTSPTFHGSLALAPKLIGPVRQATSRIEDFRAELERVVDGAARAYTSISAVSTDGADVIKVLHISDIHLSPLGQDFARQIATGFDVDFVIDTGDLTSFGTPPEAFVLRQIRGIGMPYVFVRGNHDSLALQAAMARLPNAVVLDGEARTVDGLTIYGLGHPVFTPDRTVSITDRQFADEARAAGERVLGDVRALPSPPDIVAVHDDRMAESVAGLVPLVLSGHFHEEGQAVDHGTLYLRVGSTGGSGFGVFERTGGVPLSAEVLYFERAPEPKLIAYDVIDQSPQSGSLTVDRHVVRREFGELTPSPPPPSASKSGSTSGSASDGASPSPEGSRSPERSPPPSPGGSGVG
jgi:predicted phosphodiesterase